MSPYLDQIIGSDHFTEAERSAIRDAVRRDPKLKEAVASWAQLAGHVSNRWAEDVPSRNVLVLLALKETLPRSILNDDESKDLAEAGRRLEDIMSGHPAVATILDRIRDDAASFHASWDAVLGSRSDRAAQSSVRKPMRLVRTALSVAAVIALFAIGIRQFTPNATSPVPQVVTAMGEMKTVTLDDGTTVRMHPGSSLTWSDEFERTLTFEGAAFFDVTASPEPFIVHTSHSQTTVLGTSFGIRTLPDAKTEVTLVSGRVSVSSSGNADQVAVLEPGQQSIISSSRVTVENVELNTALNWSELIVFRDTQMKKVAKTLAERFAVTITVADDLQKTPLTGTFDQSRGIHAILDIIAAALGADLDIQKEGSAYHLSRP